MRSVEGIRITREVGRSHVGVVYQGLGAPGNQPVVVKIGDSQRAELRVSPGVFAALNHPGIARLRTATLSEHNEPVIAHDVPAGDPLTMAVRRYEGQYRQIAHFIREAAAVLAHAHALGVTHGDISPRNLYVDPDDGPLFCEFGLGLVTPESVNVADIARSGGDAGAARERKFKVDERADVFALGNVLYYLLTGSAATEQPLALMSDPDSPHDDIAPIDRVAPEAPTELRAICAQALATDPVHRYLHARDMVRDLESYLYGKRGRPWVKVGMVVVGALMVGLFGLWGTVDGGPARIVAVEAWVVRAGEAEGAPVAIEFAERALSPRDRLELRVQLSRPGFVSVLFRDPEGRVHVVAPGDDDDAVQQFVIPARGVGPVNGWEVPDQPGGAVLAIVAHSKPSAEIMWIEGTLATVAPPPRSYAALLLYGRHLTRQPMLDTLPPRADDRMRSSKTFPEYADQLVRELGRRGDDAVIGLVYVMSR